MKIRSSRLEAQLECIQELFPHFNAALFGLDNAFFTINVLDFSLEGLIGKKLGLKICDRKEERQMQSPVAIPTPILYFLSHLKHEDTIYVQLLRN